MFFRVFSRDDIDLTWAWLTYNLIRDGLETANSMREQKGVVDDQKKPSKWCSPKTKQHAKQVRQQVLMPAEELSSSRQL